MEAVALRPGALDRDLGGGHANDVAAPRAGGLDRRERVEPDGRA
jgi:hypothetical protein